MFLTTNRKTKTKKHVSNNEIFQNKKKKKKKRERDNFNNNWFLVLTHFMKMF